jgi:hypothetical protein
MGKNPTLLLVRQVISVGKFHLSALVMRSNLQAGTRSPNQTRLNLWHSIPHCSLSPLGLTVVHDLRHKLHGSINYTLQVVLLELEHLTFFPFCPLCIISRCRAHRNRVPWTPKHYNDSHLFRHDEHVHLPSFGSCSFNLVS